MWLKSLLNSNKKDATKRLQRVREAFKKYVYTMDNDFELCEQYMTCSIDCDVEEIGAATAVFQVYGARWSRVYIYYNMKPCSRSSASTTTTHNLILHEPRCCH